MFLKHCEAENVAQDSDYSDAEHDGSLGGVPRQMHLKDEQLPSGMGFSAVGVNVCLGRPLERFRVLASGRVCGRARGKRSSSKRLLRHKVL